ncbi:MAG TPA: chemotaxis protein CheB [Segetibacter sp.]|nr:chemotaxis protein CheB [Segetibacter sp.]
MEQIITKDESAGITKHYPIVAIGASAGGLEAMIELLSALPADTNLAYVYIQHLDRDFDSKLTEILQRYTKMLVLEAKDLLPLNPNHLYVIPPDKDLSIIDGVIKVSQRPPKGILHLPIDKFFNSLAQKRKEAAIGVILSGSASDGAIGMKAIKMAGGFTFAQDESAKYRSMPTAAIAEGVVDAILPPHAIARELEHLSKKAHLLQHLFSDDDIEELIPHTEESVDIPVKEENLSVILSQLKIATGVDFTH